MSLTLFVTLFAFGCASSKASKEEGAESTVYMNVESVRVMVEGRDRGLTPMILNVARNRGEYEIDLMHGRTLVRKFEIGHGGDQRSPERHAMYMDLARDNSGMGFRTFDLADLESPNDTLYLIPYLPQGISIEDRKYGLTLIITDQ
jgi:hypothetical protein